VWYGDKTAFAVALKKHLKTGFLSHATSSFTRERASHRAMIRVKNFSVKTRDYLTSSFDLTQSSGATACILKAGAVIRL
jgi:hypothetical protein